MSLSREIYQALEDIVGSDYISDDPVLLETYRYSLAHTAIHLGPYFNTYTPRGEAVLLPGSTEEVQHVVRACNKYRLKVKASSTFWSAMGFPSGDNTIQLDMRRMDRILEIDKKNMFAVVEPYVIGSTLQAEAMKVGLNTHIIGAGCSCSPLASASSYTGMGPDSIFMGCSTENLLGAEWVMPNGDVLRTGSLGSGLGWFCGDGPGPSLRALIRGYSGGMGAKGVFTKLALKLYPWPGPTSLPVEGTVPAYKAALPDNFRVYTLSFPSWAAWADSCYLLWDTGLGYIVHRQFNMFGRDLKGAMLKILTDPARTLSDLEGLLKDSKVRKLTEDMKRDYQIVLVGMTQRDIEWQETALDQILKITGGWKVEEMINDPNLRDWSLLYLIRLGHKNLNLVYGGGYDGCFGMSGAPDFGTAHIEEVTEFKKKWEKKGEIVAAGGDSTMGGLALIGGGGSTVWENFTHFDPYDKESTEGTFEFFEASSKYTKEHNLGTAMERANAAARGPDGKTTAKEVRERILLASAQPSIYRYQRKIKEAIDPNDLGDGYLFTL